MNRSVFFDAVRSDPFGGSLTAPQVSGMDAILTEWEKRGWSDVRWLAYMLATTYHETARTMQPIKEFGSRAYFMKMYDKSGDRPKVASALGNVVVGDGAIFCGRGFVQLTGRRNYKLASDKLGVDCVSNPELVMKPVFAAQIMFAGMSEGWFTGKKLADYIGAKIDFRGARRIINGTDKADTIAGYAKAFHTALKRAAEASEPPVIIPAKPVPPPPDIHTEPPEQVGQPDAPQPASSGFFNALIAFIRALFSKGN